MYVISVYDPMHVCLQFTELHKAYDEFDKITNRGKSAYLYSYKDGVFTELQHVCHKKNYVGAMR